MNRQRKNKLFLLTILLMISVGFALLSSNLNIIGNSTLKRTVWNIYWDNVQVNSGSVSGTKVVNPAEITDQEKTMVEYAVILDTPGDFYEFTVDAKNDGTLDAMVDVVSNKVYAADGETERDLPDYLTYTVTYEDGSRILVDDLLEKNTSKTYKVRVEFKTDIDPEDLPTTAEEICFKFSVDYVQRNDDNKAEYTVIHKYEKLDSGYDEEIQTLRGTIGSQVTPDVRAREGFDSPEPQTVTIAADSSTTVTYIYTRKEYTFTITDRTYIDPTTTPNGTYKYGTELTLKAQERQDYTFEWSDGDTHYERTLELTDNITLTPIYELDVYNITLNANGGTVDPRFLQVIKGHAIGTIPTPVLSGYFLGGWFSTIEGGIEITDSYIPESDMEIFASWKVSVAQASIANEHISIEAGDQETIEITNEEMIEEDYTFTSNNTSVATVDEEGKVSGVAGGNTTITITGLESGDTKTVTVEVAAAQTYTIIFNANGGLGSMNNQVARRGANITLTKNGFFRDKYLYRGWNTEPDGSGEDFLDEQSVVDITENNEINLYAKWELDPFPVEFLQVGACTFNGSEGTITGEGCQDYVGQKYIDTEVALYSPENINKDYEMGFRIISYNPSDNVQQATFVNTKKEGGGYPGAVVRKADNNIHIASRRTSTKNSEVKLSYQEIESVKLFRIYNEDSDVQEIYYSINDGEKILLNDLSEYNPTFDLTTWFGAYPLDAAGTPAQRYLNGTLADMYIKLGKYSDDVPRQVDFNANGGTVSPEFVLVPDGAVIGALPTPKRDLYDFVGWYTELEGGIEVTPTYIVTRDVEIFARWQKRPVYTIDFDTDGGSAIEDIEIEQGHAIGTLPIPRKEGNSFEGWYLESTLETPVNRNYVPTGDTTLYAKWTETTFPTVFKQTGECTFNGTDGTITGQDCQDYANQKYIDTGISLYSSENIDKDYEIGFEIVDYDSTLNESRATFATARAEQTSFYPGVVFRRIYEQPKLEVQSRKTSTTNEVRTYQDGDITSFAIYRINGEIYYSINGGARTYLNDLSLYNPIFDQTTWFGASPVENDPTRAHRYLTGTLKNMYVKLGAYQEEGKYSIRLNPNGGSLSQRLKTITQGNRIGSLPSPEMENKTFLGWYTRIDGGELIDSNYVPSSNIEIYARWE